MIKKYLKSFILFFLFFLSYHFFVEKIAYAKGQTTTVSQKTNDITLQNSIDAESSTNILKDDSNNISTSQLEKDSKTSVDDTVNNSTTTEEPKDEEFISYGWKFINNKKYYIVDNKILENTGWFSERDVNPNITSKDKNYNDKYYLDSDFSVVVGWKQIKGNWYYFNSDGIMQNGWIWDTNWYYTNDKGIMETNWQKIDGYTYYFNQYGQMATYKKLIDNNWYFFNDKGQLQKGFYYYNGIKYYSDSNGIMVTNKWINTDKHKLYIKADSSVAIGELYLNGIMEEFNSNGFYEGKNNKNKDYLFVKHLNVGNADAAFIKLPSGETVLIDTGDTTTSKTLIDFLNSQNLKTEFFQANSTEETSDGGQTAQSNTNKASNSKGVIDYVVLTHPHSDHIGGMIDLMKNFNIGKILVPKYFEMKDFVSNINDTTSSAKEKEIMKYDYDVYKKTMDAIKKNGIPLVTANPNTYIDSRNILQFLHVNKDYPSFEASRPYEEYTLLNNNSAIVYLNYKNFQELFTADIEWGAENDFFTRKALTGKSVDVLKVPHHGNATSSSYDFIGYVKPIIGVIPRAKESIDTNNASYDVLITCGVSLYETSVNDGVSIYATKDNWNVESNSKGK